MISKEPTILVESSRISLHKYFKVSTQHSENVVNVEPLSSDILSLLCIVLLLEL